MKWDHTKRERKDESKDSLWRRSSPGQKADAGEAIVDLFARAHGGSIITPLTVGLGLGDVALSAGTAPRGDMARDGSAAAAAQAAGLGVFALTHTPSIGIGRALASNLLPYVNNGILKASGAVAGGLIPAALAIGADYVVRHGVKKIWDAALANRPIVRFGGFKDSLPAYTMRQRSEQELSGGMLNARRYLGQEGQLTHQ